MKRDLTVSPRKNKGGVSFELLPADLTPNLKLICSDGELVTNVSFIVTHATVFSQMESDVSEKQEWKEIKVDGTMSTWRAILSCIVAESFDWTVVGDSLAFEVFAVANQYGVRLVERSLVHWIVKRERTGIELAVKIANIDLGKNQNLVRLLQAHIELVLEYLELVSLELLLFVLGSQWFSEQSPTLPTDPHCFFWSLNISASNLWKHVARWITLHQPSTNDVLNVLSRLRLPCVPPKIVAMEIASHLECNPMLLLAAYHQNALSVVPDYNHAKRVKLPSGFSFLETLDIDGNLWDEKPQELAPLWEYSGTGQPKFQTIMGNHFTKDLVWLIKLKNHARRRIMLWTKLEHTKVGDYFPMASMIMNVGSITIPTVDRVLVKFFFDPINGIVASDNAGTCILKLSNNFSELSSEGFTGIMNGKADVAEVRVFELKQAQ